MKNKSFKKVIVLVKRNLYSLKTENPMLVAAFRRI